MPDLPRSYPFVFSPSARPLLRLLGARPDSCEVLVEHDVLEVRYGRWRLVTWLGNVRSAEVAGPYRPWKVLGPRLSLADRGLTFGTNADRGVCIAFRRPVPGLEPTGLLRHPNLTVTVADPASLADRLNRHLPVPAEQAVRPPAAPTEEQA